MKKIITVTICIIFLFACKSTVTPEENLLPHLDSLAKHMEEYNVSCEKLLQLQREELKTLQMIDSIYKNTNATLKKLINK